MVLFIILWLCGYPFPFQPGRQQPPPPPPPPPPMPTSVGTGMSSHINLLTRIIIISQFQLKNMDYQNPPPIAIVINGQMRAYNGPPNANED